MIPVIGIIIGLVLGLLLNISIPPAYASYVAVLILATLDAVIGGTTAQLRGRFSTTLFLTGLAFNLAIALLITALGEQLNIPLVFVSLFAFGNRIFQNVGRMRRLLLRRFRRDRQLDFDDDDSLT